MHKHHIVPKHMGGTDDPDNLVELTVQEHADAHNLLWCLHKNPLDKIAELGLLGQITMSEAARLAHKYGSGRKPGYSHTQEWKDNMSKLMTNREHTWGDKISAAMKGRKFPGRTYPERECPHCGKVGKGPSMSRYHFDNCKEA